MLEFSSYTGDGDLKVLLSAARHCSAHCFNQLPALEMVIGRQRQTLQDPDFIKVERDGRLLVRLPKLALADTEDEVSG